MAERPALDREERLTVEAAYAQFKMRRCEPFGPYENYAPEVDDQTKEMAWAGAQSVVYFARSNETGRIKIGRSTQLTRRMGELSCNSESGVELLCWLPETFLTEGQVHDYLGRHRHKGEWFNATAQVEEYIAYVTRMWGRRI